MGELSLNKLGDLGFPFLVDDVHELPDMTLGALPASCFAIQEKVPSPGGSAPDLDSIPFVYPIHYRFDAFIVGSAPWVLGSNRAQINKNKKGGQNSYLQCSQSILLLLEANFPPYLSPHSSPHASPPEQPPSTPYGVLSRITGYNYSFEPITPPSGPLSAFAAPDQSSLRSRAGPTPRNWNFLMVSTIRASPVSSVCVEAPHRLPSSS